MELDREEFRSWLVAQEPDAVVGFPREAGHCPIARYYRERTAAQWWVGIGVAVLASDADTVVWFPSWADGFVRAVDRREFEVTAKEALTDLDGVDL